MAKTALNELQEQIEAVRLEAYAAGYAAAMQAIRDFLANAAPPAAGESASPSPRRGRPAKIPSATFSISPRTARAPAKSSRVSARPQRGTNARLIEEILHSSAPRALRPAEIRTALRRDKGVAMAFTSIRHALGQLEARRSVEQITESKTWRYRDGAAAASASAN